MAKSVGTVWFSTNSDVGGYTSPVLHQPINRCGRCRSDHNNGGFLLRVWVDLTNSPHVLFFAPIVRALQERGDEVLVTARRFAHTIELAAEQFDDVTEVGSGSAKSLVGKVSSLGSRARALLPVAREFQPDVAVSHGSCDQAIAARLLRIPSMVMVDYEYQPANHLSFRSASRLLLPTAMETADIEARGGRGKTARYVGLKEEVYLSNFRPEPSQRLALGIAEHTGPVVTLRPPPEGALYHRGENPLWDTLTDHLRSCEDTLTLVLPRHPSQAEDLRRTIGAPNVRVLTETIDGPALVWWSDVVVSGGGTMNREAVALGTPVWSLFSGRLGAVDRQLVSEGRMHRLLSPEDVLGLRPTVRSRGEAPDLVNHVLRQVIDGIDATARRADLVGAASTPASG